MDAIQQSERSTLMIGATEIVECIDIEHVIDTVEDAFVAYQRGDVEMPPKSYVDAGDYNGDFRSMPAVVNDAAGVKWVNVHPDNPQEFGLPTVMGVVIYSDVESAYPLAIMDGTTLTRFRTGAVAGVATRYLAPPDARSLGLLGAGQQAHAQLDAIATTVNLDRVVVADLDQAATERFIEAEHNRSLHVESGTPEDVSNCDIISTTTPTRSPTIQREWIDDGTHINAMGADAKGKQEIESALSADGEVVVDDWEQCSHSGEINVPVSEGLVGRSDISANLGQIVTREAPAIDKNDITIFDSTGLAIQDIAVAQLAYESVSEQGAGTAFDLIGT